MTRFCLPQIRDMDKTARHEGVHAEKSGRHSPDAKQAALPGRKDTALKTAEQAFRDLDNS